MRERLGGKAEGYGPDWSGGGMGVVGRGGGSAGCVAAGCHLPKVWFNSATACLLSKSPAQCQSSFRAVRRSGKEGPKLLLEYCFDHCDSFSCVEWLDQVLDNDVLDGCRGMKQNKRLIC